MMSFRIEEVQRALECISSSATQENKNQALQYLEQFQKSPEAWTICNHILTADVDQSMIQLQVFASQTLRNKVTYDLSQLHGNLAQFKQTLLKLISLHSQKLIVTQLSVTLARLAIQYVEWRNPIGEIITVLNSQPGKLLEFLKILPEETLDIKSTPLTEDEFKSRVHELIDQIAKDVLNFLISSIGILKSNSNEITVTQVLNCLNTWSYEFPIEELLTVNPLVSLIFQVLNEAQEEDSDAFDAAVECLCVILKETRDVENENLISALYHELLTLQAKLLPLDQISDFDEYYDIMDGLTRLFVEAGEAWCVFIAKSPQVFKPLVTVLLLLTCRNSDLDIVKYTFPFWFNLKQMLVLPRFKEQRLAYQDIFVDLINGVIAHLKYPANNFSNKEEEDKFKEFRYDMGGVLKDCTAVVGSSKALNEPFTQITKAMTIPNPMEQWQNLEAPLFSLRTMAQEVSTSENVVLPQLFQMLCNMPEHPKIRYATTLVFGRYTEWAAKHPQFLEMELNYIFNGFQFANGDLSILTASSHALMYFCQDCSALLSDYVDQLVNFYWKIEPMVDTESLFEVCQGLSAVINQQPIERIGPSLELFIKPQLSNLVESVAMWKSSPSSKDFIRQVCDKIDMIFAVFEELKPRYEFPKQGEEPLEPYISTIWDTMHKILVDEGASSCEPIVEIAMKWLRKVFFNFHIFAKPILPSVANYLVQGYSTTGFGVYLWCSGAIISVFGDDESYSIESEVKDAVWQFTCSQCVTFMRNFEKVDHSKLDEIYDSIQDFFIMITDVIMFYPDRFIVSELLEPVFDVGLRCVCQVKNYDCYITIVRALDDILSWGFETPPISTVAIDDVPIEWRQCVITKVVQGKGSELVVSLLMGLVSNFSSDAHPDVIGCIVKCLNLATQATGDATVCMEWLSHGMDTLGKVTDQERAKLMTTVGNALPQRDLRRVRNGIKDFVSWYLRKNVSPRLYKSAP